MGIINSEMMGFCVCVCVSLYLVYISLSWKGFTLGWLLGRAGGWNFKQRWDLKMVISESPLSQPNVHPRGLHFKDGSMGILTKLILFLVLCISKSQTGRSLVIKKIWFNFMCVFWSRYQYQLVGCSTTLLLTEVSQLQLYHHQVDICGFMWVVSTTIGWPGHEIWYTHSHLCQKSIPTSYIVHYAILLLCPISK